VPLTGTILIVDFESTIVDLLVEVLSEEGHAVYSARDGAGALTTIARHPPALILLDVGRAGLHGAKTLEQVRKVCPATIPIVLMTTDPRNVAPLLALGAVECLAKPFDLADLLACVARHLGPVQIPGALACTY